MILRMRATLTIDEHIIAALKALAHQQGLSFEHVVNQTLRRGLDAGGVATRRKPYRVKSYSLGSPLLPSLDKSLALAGALEDAEIARKSIGHQ